MEFPFEVPADLDTASDEELTALLANIREFAAGLTEGSATPTTETIDTLRACRDLAKAANTELADRGQRATEAAALAAELADTFVDDDLAVDDDDLAKAKKKAMPGTGPNCASDADAPVDEVDEPAAVTAADRRRRLPAVRNVAARRGERGAPDVETDHRAWASLTAAADVPGFSTGQQLNRFDEAAAAIAARLDQYPSMSAGQTIWEDGRRPVSAFSDSGRVLEMQSYSRHGAVQIRRTFPDELRVRDEAHGMRTAEYAASERRLPGGSLVESARRQVEGGRRALTAAVGWCAPSDVIYDLVELETLDGMLDVPELQTTRGGWQIPTGGGPLFSTIWNGIGSSGETHLTEAQVISGTSKVCYDIPCPGFTDVRLGVDYVCLTGGLLQRRGYPEVVARFSRGTLTALAHKINKGVISQIITAAGATNVIPSDPSGDDAISGLMAAVDLAIIDMKYSTRLSFNGTMEVVLPMWVLAQLRAAATRRTAADELVNIADAQIMAWFAERRAVPRFVYDWQDSFSGLATGPGGSTPLKVLPTTCEFIVYPAGTFVKAVQDVIMLDTIYDSTKLATNQYTALFAEDGWAVLQMGPLARRYTAQVDPSGVVGCCPS